MVVVGNPVDNCTCCGSNDIKTRVFDRVHGYIVCESEDICSKCGFVVSQFSYGAVQFFPYPNLQNVYVF